MSTPRCATRTLPGVIVLTAHENIAMYNLVTAFSIYIFSILISMNTQIKLLEISGEVREKNGLV